MAMEDEDVGDTAWQGHRYRICPICEARPFHAPEACPVVTSGPDAIDFRMVELEAAGHPDARVIAMLQALRKAAVYFEAEQVEKGQDGTGESSGGGVENRDSGQEGGSNSREDHPAATRATPIENDEGPSHPDHTIDDLITPPLEYADPIQIDDSAFGNRDMTGGRKAPAVSDLGGADGPPLGQTTTTPKRPVLTSSEGSEHQPPDTVSSSGDPPLGSFPTPPQQRPGTVDNSHALQTFLAVLAASAVAVGQTSNVAAGSSTTPEPQPSTPDKHPIVSVPTNVAGQRNVPTLTSKSFVPIPEHANAHQARGVPPVQPSGKALVSVPTNAARRTNAPTLTSESPACLPNRANSHQGLGVPSVQASDEIPESAIRKRIAEDDSKDPEWLKELTEFLTNGPGFTRGWVNERSSTPVAGDPDKLVGKIEGDDWAHVVKALNEMERMMGFPSRDVGFSVRFVVA